MKSQKTGALPSRLRKRELIRNTVAHNFNYKVLALMVTLVLWVATLEKKDFERQVTVPIEPLIEESVVLSFLEPDTLEVTLSGKRMALMRLGELTYTLNLANFQPGTHIESLNLDYLPLPEGVTVKDIQPRLLKFVLQPAH